MNLFLIRMFTATLVYKIERPKNSNLEVLGSEVTLLFTAFQRPLWPWDQTWHKKDTLWAFANLLPAMAGPPSMAIYHSKSNISVSGSFSFQIVCLKKCQNASPHHKYWDVSPQPSTRWAWRGGSASQWNQQPRQPPPREHGSRCVPVIPIKLPLELRLRILLCSNFL